MHLLASTNQKRKGALPGGTSWISNKFLLLHPIWYIRHESQLHNSSLLSLTIHNVKLILFELIWKYSYFDSKCIWFWILLLSLNFLIYYPLHEVPLFFLENWMTYQVLNIVLGIQLVFSILGLSCLLPIYKNQRKTPSMVPGGTQLINVNVL